MKQQRRRLVVDRKLQSRIIASTSWPAALCLGVTALLLGVFGAVVTEQMLEADLELNGLFALLLCSLAFMVASTVFFLLNCLKVSHRVAGPIYRINRTLKDIEGGARSLRIKLRKGDFLESLSDELNAFLDFVEPHLPPGEAKTEDVRESGEPAHEPATVGAHDGMSGD